MKTKGLDIFEAYEALRAGKCVKPKDWGHAHKFENGKFYYWNTYGDKIETSDFYGSGSDLYEIHPDPSIPEPKSLTFDEGVQALMDGKTLVVKESHRKHTASRLDGHSVVNVNYLDLAERRGWAIHETNS